MSADDFDKADAQAGVEVLPAERKKSYNSNLMTSDVMEYREKLLERYHKGASSLVERLKNAGKDDMESLLVSLIDEMVKETDHLLGNELVATVNGELRDASVISFKRAEVLEKAIKSVQAKHEAEKVEGLDIDSPEMMTVFRFFMLKSNEAFERMGVGKEVSDLFFRTFGGMMDNWKRELREHFEKTRVPGST
jgi:hypothetical protein